MPITIETVQCGAAKDTEIDMMTVLNNLIGAVLCGAIRAYQLLLSPVLPVSCRYQPTCSSYAIEALRRHGVIGGGWLALKRVVGCHPWGDYGCDPVPDCDHHADNDGHRPTHRGALS